MKFAETIFPKGSFPKQQTDGLYIDDTLANNLNIYAKHIANDMHFMIVLTGTDSVGNGKSTLATHIGTYLTNKINEINEINNTFTHRNVVFSSKKLTKRSHDMPKYSVIVLDEGDDLTTHGMKQSAVELKRYFRKCRQLNQILILILPSFFELPKFYALARSHALINVSFENEFERGFFKFYGPTAKKLLYMKGKKEWDYTAHRDDFAGRFTSHYSFFPDLERETGLYKRDKYKDMIDDEKGKEEYMSPIQLRKKIEVELFNQIYSKLKGEVTLKQLSHAFSITTRTATNWIASYNAPNSQIPLENELESGIGNTYTINLTQRDDDGEDERDEDI